MRLVVSLGLFCGLRPGESLGLQWENIDIAGGTISIKHSQSPTDGLKDPKSPSGVRTVPLPDWVLSELEALAVCYDAKDMAIAQVGMSGDPSAVSYGHGKLVDRWSEPIDLTVRRGHIILNYDRKPMRVSDAGDMFRLAMKRAGLWIDDTNRSKFSAYALRHAAASLMIASDLPPLHLKQFMGHKKVTATLDVYGHLFPDDSRISEASHRIASSFAALSGCSSRDKIATRDVKLLN